MHSVHRLRNVMIVDCRNKHLCFFHSIIENWLADTQNPLFVKRFLHFSFPQRLWSKLRWGIQQKCLYFEALKSLEFTKEDKLEKLLKDIHRWISELTVFFAYFEIMQKMIARESVYGENVACLSTLLREIQSLAIEKANRNEFRYLSLSR